MMKRTLGGDRISSGKRMEVHLHGYERSTHDLSRIWRSTMSVGTIVPFFNELALPGDTFDMTLNIVGKTHPTTGPLFGSMEIDCHVFVCPVRLYQGQLHNNELGIGNNMSLVKLPIIELLANEVPITPEYDTDNAQINPSCILAYQGIRGVGLNTTGTVGLKRPFNALKWLGYVDIYKNYFANKQEEIGAVIHTTPDENVETIDSVTTNSGTIPFGISDNAYYDLQVTPITLNYTGTVPKPSQVMFVTVDDKVYSAGDLSATGLWTDDGTKLESPYNVVKYGVLYVKYWRYRTPEEQVPQQPQVVTFPLSEIDDMRTYLLRNMGPAQLKLNDANLKPWSYILNENENALPKVNSQEGLLIKTYKSDLFNNWLNTEWIDGSGGINEITAIDTSEGSFTIDTLNLSKKVYDMLNRIAVSGGSYDDWLDAVYTHDRYHRVTTPMYMGGLMKEMVFEEITSYAESDAGAKGLQPLGTLAGKGVMGQKHKGGDITIKVDEPCYIIGVVSITPRIDYSQGNKWDSHLMTMDDFHKPALDEIGFQELITEQMAWWDTRHVEPGVWERHSAGKQPAWINYMTAVNETYGNFAVKDNEMFMTLNRRYEPDNFFANGIKDLTTYIDPVKFNNIFADTALDAQNFWIQIGVNCTARRKMSAKLMPNL